MYVMKRFPSRGIFLGVSVEHTFPTNSLNCRVLDAPSRKFEVTRAVRNITERISVPHEMPLSAYTRKYRICLIYIYYTILLQWYFGNRADSGMNASILVIRAMKYSHRIGPAMHDP